MTEYCEFLVDALCHEPGAKSQRDSKYCSCCLMGKLIVELRRLRVTGIQP